MSSWVCPGCQGIIKSSSDEKLERWKANHQESCPRRGAHKEKS